MAVLSAFCGSVFLCPALALAEERLPDFFAQGPAVELSFGLFAPSNTLQDTLTTRNGGGPQLQSTDLLDLGLGGRASLAYSRPWGETSRLVFSFTGAAASGESRIQIGSIAETFPGTHDDGLNLPAGWSVDAETETRMAMLSIGREWAARDGWRFSAGLQGGTASQDLTALVRAIPPVALFDGELWSTTTAQSSNRMVGVYGGVSRYMPMSDRLALRLSANLGVMHNRFEYEYTHVINAVGVAPNTRNFTASDSGTAISTKVSARLERLMGNGGLLSLELGYDALHGVGNGIDTFLDVDGRRNSAAIDSDTIGATYLSVGYAFRF